MKDDQKGRIRIILFTLFGLILPLGNVWGPLLANCQTDDLRRYRNKMIAYGAAFCVASITFGIYFWLKAMPQIEAGQPFYSTGLKWSMVSLPMLIIANAVVQATLTLKWKSKN